MLETLDKIDWKEINGFFNPGNIPRLIRDLTSSDPQICRQAISELYEELWHQQTVCDTTIFAVPFLIELLLEPSVDNKASIVILLSAISFDPSGYMHPAGVFFQKILNDYQPPSEWALYDTDINRVRGELHKGYLIYQQLLSVDEPPVLRGATSYLLGILTDCDDQNINYLKSRFLTERDEQVRGIIVLAIGLLADDRPEHTSWLQNIFDTEALFLKINAAIGLARSIPDRVTAPVIDVLVDAIVNPSNVAAMFELYPWYFDGDLIASGSLQYWCRVALNKVSIIDLKLLPTIVDALAIVSSEVSYDIASSYEISYCILNSIFCGKAAPHDLTRDKLSQEQRMGLDAIANNKQFWSDYSENYNVISNTNTYPFDKGYYNPNILRIYYMLKDFGLPTTTATFHAFMDGHSSLHDLILEEDDIDSVPF